MNAFSNTETAKIVAALNQLCPGVDFNPSLISVMAGGVSGATVASFQDPRTGQRGVVKLLPGIGIKERMGRQLLKPHLLCPTEWSWGGDDAYIYKYVVGRSVDSLLSDSTEATRHLIDALGMYADMWNETRGQKELVGYPKQLEQTFQIVETVIAPRCELSKLNVPLVINGFELPPLARVFDALGKAIQTDAASSLTHGDEGWGNVIVERGRSSKTQLFFIDHGKVGFRIPAESAAKAVLWFVVTQLDEGPSEMRVKRNQLIIDFEADISKPVIDTYQLAKNFICREVDIPRPMLFACFCIYLLRELQWLGIRKRKRIAPQVFGLAMQAAGVVLGQLEDIPILG